MPKQYLQTQDIFNRVFRNRSGALRTSMGYYSTQDYMNAVFDPGKDALRVHADGAMLSMVASADELPADAEVSSVCPVVPGDGRIYFYRYDNDEWTLLKTGGEDLNEIWEYVGRDDGSGLSGRVKNAEDSVRQLRESAISVAGDGAIAVAADGADRIVTLKLDAAEKVLAQSDDGLRTAVQLKAFTDGLGANISREYALVGGDGETELGSRIQIEKDRFLSSAAYDADSHRLTFNFNLADGTSSATSVDLNGLVDVYTAGDGLSKDGGSFSGKVDPGSEKFLTVGPDGFRVSGVQEAAASAAAEAAESVRASLETAVQLVSVTVKIGRGTSGQWSSETIPGRVMHVSDARGVIYPEIRYSSDATDCTTTLSADFGSKPLTEDETWHVVYAKPVESVAVSGSADGNP